MNKHGFNDKSKKNQTSDFEINRKNIDEEFDYSQFKQSYSRFKLPGKTTNNTKVKIKLF